MNFQSVHRQDFKSAIASVKSFYNSCFYYQLSEYVSYFQSYSMSVYQQDEWSSQDYNNYWKNKAQQQSSASQISELWNDLSVISVTK